jgi:hypothetical protein
MSIIDSQTKITNFDTKSIMGTVIGLEMADWAGFKSGRILLTTASGMRHEFRYGRNSVGNLPEIGDQVEIEYTGSHLFEVSILRTLNDQSITISDRAITYAAGLNLIAGRPKAAAVFSISETLVGIALCIIGVISGVMKPAAPYIFGIVGIFQICLAGIVWEYTKE